MRAAVVLLRTIFFLPTGARRALCVSVLIVGGLVGGAQESSADEAGNDDAQALAEAEFRKGQKLFDEKDFRGALKRYRKAYDAAEIPALLFNIAQCHRNLGEYRKARDNFRKYLSDADEPSNRASVEKTLEQLGLLRKALKHVRARRYEKAIALFDEALALELLAPIHRDRGRSLERIGKFSEAIDSYRDYLRELPTAEDSDEIEEAIARLEKELNGPGVLEDKAEPQPIYKKWWFWGGVAGTLAVAAVVTYAVTDDGIPGSDLGNVGFDR